MDRSWRRRVVTWLVIVAVGYAAIALAVFVWQAKLIFVGANFGRGQPLQDVPGVTVDWLQIRALDGAQPTRFRIANAAPANPTAVGVIVFFLGNGEDLRSGVRWAGLWRQYGLHALVVEYPGYGDSEGAPSAASILAAADVAADAASERARSLAVPLFAGGTSLGTFSAVHVAAARDDVERLVLSAPPTSLLAAARLRFGWLPVGWLLRHRFDSLALAPRVSCPVLVLHGDQDHVVPQSMGRELAAAFQQSEFIDASGYAHVIPLDRGGVFGERVRGFLSGE